MGLNQLKGRVSRGLDMGVFLNDIPCVAFACAVAWELWPSLAGAVGEPIEPSPTGGQASPPIPVSLWRSRSQGPLFSLSF